MTRNRSNHRDNIPAARDLRARQTAAEVILWDALRSRRLDGLKFRHQHPVGPFVVDFCCPEHRLAIELDGVIHNAQREHDAERESLLIAARYKVVRFPNETVTENLPAVLAVIRAAADSEPSRSTPPMPRTGAL
jgi:very-short-patch-repair endonuclease